MDQMSLDQLSLDLMSFGSKVLDELSIWIISIDFTNISYKFPQTQNEMAMYLYLPKRVL